ncbi:sulfite exporter TauE/SafE family protein [Saccharomonospora xinjiangensis]|uniref:Probable membrane transporter protein n=1 Tax=Saccharomonospora xinjiangensis XJ-54 TaxID=882086 RepID=I0UYE4_9PSEU|nr:sulfite exporter TauE/SafE family protein [Saccharomonospora xinjiangensis]EID52897.1 putative permease [Saccharomonospora xinjiangensis XJ-54]
MGISVIIVLVLAVAVGLSLGLLGGGGSILTVPLLTYVAGMPAKEAIAASLFVVGTTSLISAITHARKGNVRWRTGLVFGAAGMAGAFVGGLAGGYIPDTVLMIAFALMMVATATAMIRGKKKATGENSGHGDLPLKRIILDGLVVGLVTGLVGAGGGFLVVPALALLGGLPMAIAVGTSLVVIAMKSFAGLAGYLTTVALNWPLVLGVTAAAIVGSILGAMLTSRVPEAALRKGFGIFVLVMGVFVLTQELPPPAGLVVGIVAAALAGLAIICRLTTDRCPLVPQPQAR